MKTKETARTILLIAASRGLGLAMAEEFLKKDWNVVGQFERDLAEQNCTISLTNFRNNLK